MAKNQQLNGQLTPDEIKALKDKHKLGIYSIALGGFIGYFRNPDLMDMNASLANVGKDNPLDYFINVGRETHIGGSKEVFENAALQNDFCETIKPKVEGKKGELVNL